MALSNHKDFISFFLFAIAAIFFYLVVFSSKNASGYKAEFDYAMYFIANIFLFSGFFVRYWKFNKESFLEADSFSFGFGSSAIRGHIKYLSKIPGNLKLKWVVSWFRIIFLIFIIVFLLFLKGFDYVLDLLTIFETQFMLTIAMGQLFLAFCMILLSLFLYFKGAKIKQANIQN